jgi:hypothetical protein
LHKDTSAIPSATPVTSATAAGVTFSETSGAAAAAAPMLLLGLLWPASAAAAELARPPSDRFLNSRLGVLSAGNCPWAVAWFASAVLGGGVGSDLIPTAAVHAPELLDLYGDLIGVLLLTATGVLASAGVPASEVALRSRYRAVARARLSRLGGMVCSQSERAEQHDGLKAGREQDGCCTARGIPPGMSHSGGIACMSRRRGTIMHRRGCWWDRLLLLQTCYLQMLCGHFLQLFVHPLQVVSQVLGL